MVESGTAKRRGPKLTVIPEELGVLLCRTYEEDKFCEIPIRDPEDQKKSEEVIRLALIHCRRCGKKLTHKTVQAKNGPALVLKMRDPYRRGTRETTSTA